MSLTPGHVLTVIHDPTAVLDYGLDWSSWLALVGDTLSASTWTVAGLTTASPAFAAGGTTTVWVSGGAAGTSYRLTNHVTTTGGRQDDRTIVLCVNDR